MNLNITTKTKLIIYLEYIFCCLSINDKVLKNLQPKIFEFFYDGFSL